ncbi:enoyl-CoA hydratase-related protein [Diaphorobacter sp. HDW4A]|uniref:enoyl-CoA hydratase-related protein n=1 Tax=Diaphorobacter sp. HDW4A TaxID=2714924 RepID=UPI001F1106A8|nr:enoyl-CoA hydratase-related protein [Diaphorobacter sp. HDW4A]
MQSSELGCEIRNRVALLTINRPERMNAWTPALEQQFKARILEIRSDDEIRCIVLTGAGKAFCAGMDMQVLQSGPSTPTPSTADADPRYSYLTTLDKPFIAAINGAAAGVGLCIALYSDLRFVTPEARLTAPYARRGLVAEHGIAWLLPRLIGPMHAADLLLSGRTVSGAEAGRMGLANVLPAEGFLDAVLERANEIANLGSPRSTRIMKQQLLAAREGTLAEATRVADREMTDCKATEDFREGVQHFIEKRPPHFTGR